MQISTKTNFKDEDTYSTCSLFHPATFQNAALLLLPLLHWMIRSQAPSNVHPKHSYISKLTTQYNEEKMQYFEDWQRRFKTNRQTIEYCQTTEHCEAICLTRSIYIKRTCLRLAQRHMLWEVGTKQTMFIANI